VGDTLAVSGNNPLILLCRGDVIIEGNVVLTGRKGGPGLDTDGSTLYSTPGAASGFGAGGLSGPGGGAGGVGGDPRGIVNSGDGQPGRHARRPEFHANTPEGFEPIVGNGGGGGPVGGGGGGGGFGTAGADGSGATNGGAAFGDATFTRGIADFQPDRAYMPNMNITGGTGGGGGGMEDDSGASEAPNGTPENGDDGGGGGGGAGGGIIIIALGEIRVTGTINASGGAGGDTFGPADQLRSPGEDGMPFTGDDFITGVNPGATPSGQGLPGGGGSGGGIVLISKTSVFVTGTLTAAGGAGGSSATITGASGGAGRIAIGLMPGGTSALGGATIVPAAATFTWNPTTHLASVGQSHWFDLFTPTADFNPDITGDGVGDSPPFFSTNFSELTTAGLVQGTDFDGILEFQGADTLSPVPGGAAPPATATGLTQWNPDVNLIDGKRYIRYRWRLFARDGYPAYGAGAQEMPAVRDMTIPFRR
jgi:hypothetical protein